MNQGIFATSFAEIAQRYAVILFDAYGVLKTADGVLEGVPDLLARLRQQGKQLFLLTNDASRSPAQLAASYHHESLGQLLREEEVLSSGILATDLLRSSARQGRVLYLGGVDSTYYIKAAGLEPISVAACDDPAAFEAFLLLDDEGFEWEQDLNKAVNLLRARDVPMIVANADVAYPIGGGRVAIAAGSLASAMESVLCREMTRLGKPGAGLFSLALDRVRGSCPGLGERDVLMVGDTLGTDIKGGNACGVDTVLVLTGNVRADEVGALITASGIAPTYVCESVLT